jgi:hypothetical protein
MIEFQTPAPGRGRGGKSVCYAFREIKYFLCKKILGYNSKLHMESCHGTNRGQHSCAAVPFITYRQLLVPGRVIDGIVNHVVVGVVANKVALCYHPYSEGLG